jgi:hypothetical protein
MTYADSLKSIDMSSGASVSIYQIYYDEASRQKLDSGFIPLDNSLNARPDWFEFWVILNFLRNNELRDDTWYGFLSPKFTSKTRLPGCEIKELLTRLDPSYSVAIFSHTVDQLIFFDNVFAQGEFWHPGMTDLTNTFLRASGLNIDVRRMVSHSHNAGFSNYIVAKAPFWRNWRLFADAFWSYVEHGDAEAAGMIKGITTYNQSFGPMKTFMQERLMAIILAITNSKVYATPLEITLGHYEPEIREVLISMDVLKRRHLETDDPRLLEAFRAIREGFAFDKERIAVVRK